MYTAAWSVLSPALLATAVFADWLLGIFRAVWFWCLGGCVRRVARHGRMVRTAPQRYELCACEFLHHDGSIARTLERGGSEPLTHSDVFESDYMVRRAVAAFEVRGRRDAYVSDADLHRCRQFLYDHCSGFNRKVEPTVHEIVKLMEATCGVELESRVEVLMADMTDAVFTDWDVVAF